MKRRLATLSLAAALLASGCGNDPATVRCGPGTVLVGDTCVVAPADAAAQVDASGTIDAGADGGSPDASEPDRCRGADLSICEGDVVVDCVTGSRTTCTGEACHVLTRSDASREAFCAPEGVVPCDSTEREARCDGDVLRQCLRRVDPTGRVLPGWEIERNCAEAGPDASCQLAPSAHCELTDCDVTTTPPACESGGRVRMCGADGLIWWDCAGGFVCRQDRTRPDVVCVPPEAVMSSRGSILEESIACVGSSVRRQHGGWEWTQSCEDAVIRIDGTFESVPTSCVSSGGLAQCLPAASYRGTCTGSEWTCSGDTAVFCNAGVVESFGCVVGCDPDMLRCAAPLACDASATSGECLDTSLAAACRDDDGNGSGWIARVACPMGCSESSGFSCR